MIDVRPDPKPIASEPKEPKPLKKTRSFRSSPKFLRDEFRFRVLHEFGGRCLMADRSECRGDLDPAHIMPKQALRRLGLSEQVVYDDRDGMALCRRHHRRSDDGLERVPRELLPPSVFEFAKQFDLTYLLDKLYERSTG